MAKYLSPEERLLRLIRGKHKSPFRPEEMVHPEGKPAEGEAETAGTEQETARPEARAAEPKAREETAPAEAKKKPGRAFFKEKLLERFKLRLIEKPKFTFNVSYPHLASGAILLLIFLYMYSILSGKERQEFEGLERMIAAVSKETKVKPLPAEEREPTPEEKPAAEAARAVPKDSFEEYQKLLVEKNIFAPPVEAKKGAAPAGPTLRELVKDLRLVGIIPGDEAQAIIEDKKSGQTLFLKQGEQIDGIEIREIQSGRIILSYQEETITLSL